MVIGIVKVYLSNLRWKFKGCFGFCNNDFLDGLLPNVFFTTFLVDLGPDRWLYAITEEINED